jgi:hypothetical protein
MLVLLLDLLAFTLTPNDLASLNGKISRKEMKGLKIE